MYILSCILGTHVMRIAAEVEKDVDTAFRIAVALGKREVKAFPKEWKPKILKVGDILLTKVRLSGYDGNGFEKPPFDFHAYWSMVIDISKKGKNITIQRIMSNAIMDRDNSIIRIKPIPAIEIWRHPNGFHRIYKDARKTIIRNIQTLRGELHFETFLEDRTIWKTFETVNAAQFDSEGYITVPIRMVAL